MTAITAAIRADDHDKEQPTMPTIKIRALPTDTISAQSRMAGAVAAVAAECSPDHASRLREAWADLSDVINSSCAHYETIGEKLATADQLADHQIAWAIGQAAANDGADESLTVAAIADAIAEDRAAGCDRPSITNLEVFFGESDPAIDAAHPALCKLLDSVLS